MKLPNEWTEEYPRPETLRDEVDAMIEAFSEVLLAAIPIEELSGIYVKGSCCKAWDSPIDYVPEVSDIDVHVLFSDDSYIAPRLESLDAALAIQQQVEEHYLARVKEPIHLPRPQLCVMNHIMQDPLYVHSPYATIKTLWGEDYPRATYDEDKEREKGRKRILDNAKFLDELPQWAIDKPGKYNFTVMRGLTWRISPTAPRVLQLFGMTTAEAWSLNRTGLVRALEDKQQATLAAAYTDFYLYAWEYFLSGNADTGAVHCAIKSAAQVLQIATEIANKSI